MTPTTPNNNHSAILRGQEPYGPSSSIRINYVNTATHAVREKLARGTDEESRTMVPLRTTELRDKVTTYVLSRRICSISTVVYPRAKTLLLAVDLLAGRGTNRGLSPLLADQLPLMLRTYANNPIGTSTLSTQKITNLFLIMEAKNCGT